MGESFQSDAFLMGLDIMGVQAERIRIFIQLKNFPDVLDAQEIISELELHPQKGWTRIIPAIEELSQKTTIVDNVSYRLYDSLVVVPRTKDSGPCLKISRNSLLDSHFWKCKKSFHKLSDNMLKAAKFSVLRLRQLILGLSSGLIKSEFHASLSFLIEKSGFNGSEYKYFRRDVLEPAISELNNVGYSYQNGCLEFKINKPPAAAPLGRPPEASPPRQVDKRSSESPQTITLQTHRVAENGAKNTREEQPRQELVENNFDDLAEKLTRTFSEHRVTKNSRWPVKRIDSRVLDIPAARKYLVEHEKRHSGYAAAIKVKFDKLGVPESVRQDLIDIRGEEETLWALIAIDRSLAKGVKEHASAYCISRLRNENDDHIRATINEYRERKLTERSYAYHKIKDDIYDEEIALEKKLIEQGRDGREASSIICDKYEFQPMDVVSRNIVFTP